MKIIRNPEKDTWPELLTRPRIDHEILEEQLQAIISDVAENGDAAVKKYTSKFDNCDSDTLEITAGEIAAACDLGLWLERDQSEKEILKCYIRKNRHGPTGKVTLKYINNFTGIEEVTI